MQLQKVGDREKPTAAAPEHGILSAIYALFRGIGGSAHDAAGFPELSGFGKFTHIVNAVEHHIAREADLGLAGGRDRGVIFRKGEVLRSVRGQDALLAAFLEELDRLLAERGA